MLKRQKLGINPTNKAVSPAPISVPAPTPEAPKYTVANLVVAKAAAFDAEMDFQVAQARRQKTFQAVQEIITYLQEYEKRNTVPAGKPS